MFSKSSSSARRRLSLLILVAFAYFLCHQLSGPRHKPHGKTDRRPTPAYDNESIPRYLHRSPFREHPDLEYERRVSDALRGVEETVLRENGGDNTAEERIWQIQLGKNRGDIERGEDSLRFEEWNDEWEYSLITNTEATTFIANTFSAIPDLVSFYTSYPHDVLRADLLRYLLLWYHGGFYADMDVFPAREIKECPALHPLFPDDPDNNPNPNLNISLVLGIEIDEPNASPRTMRAWRWSRRYGFIQYTMFAPRRFSPILREAIVRVLAHTRQHIAESNFLRGPRYNEKTVLELTGPGVFTDVTLDVLSETLPDDHELVNVSVDSDQGIGDLLKNGADVQRRVTWAPFHGIREPVCVDASESKDGAFMGGLCVLPVSIWGNGQRHSGAENFHGEHACVNHRFGGTWKSWKKGWWEYLFG